MKIEAARLSETSLSTTVYKTDRQDNLPTSFGGETRIPGVIYIEFN